MVGNDGGFARIVGATAGGKTWKAWAGRPTGDSAYSSGDFGAGLLRAAAWGWQHLVQSRPTECPICTDTPDDADDWHRLWCGCHVCGVCVRQWASVALDSASSAVIQEDADENGIEPHVVELTCPSCSAPMTSRDAADALSRDSELLKR